MIAGFILSRMICKAKIHPVKQHIKSKMHQVAGVLSRLGIKFLKVQTNQAHEFNRFPYTQNTDELKSTLRHTIEIQITKFFIPLILIISLVGVPTISRSIFLRSWYGNVYARGGMIWQWLCKGRSDIYGNGYARGGMIWQWLICRWDRGRTAE